MDMGGRPCGIIVLEGADGTGKTTLARALCERYDGVYVHNRYHKNVWPFFVASLRWAARISHERLVVIDRHWPSECVYAKVYRGGTTLGGSVRALHRAFLRFGAVYVVCAPPVEVVVENHRRLKGERTEMYDDVSRVAQAYVELWRGTGSWTTGGDYIQQLSTVGCLYENDPLTRWTSYDFTLHTEDGNFSTYVSLLASFAQVRRNAVWQPGLNPHLTDVTGPVATATVCLVGDRPAVDYRRFAWPFTGCNNSSRYLNDKLHALGAVEEKLCMINVNGRTGPTVLKQLPRELKLVALGQEALRGLNQYGRRPQAVIRHPQHARRFTHHGGEYEEELRAALADTKALPADL